MYFPIADIECNPALPFFVALGLTSLSSMAGISGAFLLLPFQMSFLGYTNPGVSATNHFFNVLACPAGVFRFWREGRLVWPLTCLIALGTLPGVFAGTYIRARYLPDPSDFKVFAGFLLLYMAFKMAGSLKKGSGRKPPKPEHFCCEVRSWTLRQFSFEFQGELYAVPCATLVAMSLLVGLVGGVYGIGGGAIMAPFLVSFLGLPVHAISGATLFATFLTSLSGVVFYSVMSLVSPEYSSMLPEWRLALLFGAGGFLGMSIGARMQRRISPTALKLILVFVLLYTAGSYLLPRLF